MTTIKLHRLAPLAVLVLCVVSCGRGAHDADSTTAAPAHTSFDSAQSAVDALVAALKSDDMDALGKILGPGSEDLLSSGDSVADAYYQYGWEYHRSGAPSDSTYPPALFSPSTGSPDSLGLRTRFLYHSTPGVVDTMDLRISLTPSPGLVWP